MILYKAVKDYVAHYIQKDEVISFHENGYVVIKEFNDIDVIKIKPEEEIPDNFFE